MKSTVLFIFFTLITLFSFSQEEVQEDNSINGQFDRIYRVSTTYQVYKVISKDKYQRLKLNVLDSLQTSKKNTLEKVTLLKIKQDSIKTIQTKLASTQLDLERSSKKENNIFLFGMQLSKTTYNLILWVLILLLATSLLYFISKFIKSNMITKTAQDNLLEVEQEFEQHRKKSILNEQKLRRQLQDEINKQRNS